MAVYVGQDDEIAISLTRGQWRFAMDEVKRSDASHERLGDQESLDLGRRAREVVLPQLG